MSKAMTLGQIGAALQKKPSAVECHELVLECNRRRQQIKARLSAIDPSGRPGLVPDPPEVVSAMAKGIQGVIALKQEREELTLELEQMDRVERLCHRAEAEARQTVLRAEIPNAVKKLPRLVEHLRETMANYDAAIAATQETLNIIAEFDSAGVEYPFDDDQLAELLDLRHRAWQPRLLGVPHCVPMTDEHEPGPVGELVKKFAKSWALLYVTYSGASHGMLTTRKPPAVVDVPEYRALAESRPQERRRFAWPRLT